MAKIEKISVKEVEEVAYCLAKSKLEYNEPIPAFNTRYPNVLESCLLVPFQTFSKKLLYQGLVSKAAILFYLMIKNRPFQNGNKRIAMTTLLVFLAKNRRWLKVNVQEFYEFTMRIASSPAEDRREYSRIVVNFISKHLITLEEPL